MDYYNEASVIDAIELGELPILTIHTKLFNNEIRTYFSEIPIDTFNDIYQYLFEFRYYYAIYRILKGASKRNIKLFHMCCKYTLSDSDNKNLNYENNSDDEDIDSEDNEIDSDEEFFFHEEDDEDRHENDIRDLCYLNFFLEAASRTFRNIDIYKNASKYAIDVIKKYKHTDVCREQMKNIVCLFLESDLEHVYDYRNSSEIIYECLVLHYRSFESHITSKINEILKNLYYKKCIIPYIKDFSNIDSTINKIIAAITLFRNRYIFRQDEISDKQKMLFVSVINITNHYNNVKIDVPSVIDILHHFETDCFKFMHDESGNIGIEFTEIHHNNHELFKVI